MDPFTISAAVAPLLISSAKLMILIGTVKDSYKNAPNMLVAMVIESKLMHVALSKIQGLVYKNESQLSAQVRSQPHLQDVFDSALTACRLTLDALRLEIDGLVEPDQQNGKSREAENVAIGFRAKVKMLWKEDTMKEILNQTRRLMTSLQNLVSILERSPFIAPLFLAFNRIK